MPVHSFLARSGLRNYDFLFLFDPNTTHYQRGIPGLGETLHELSNALEDFINTQGYSRIQTFGASAGGLASLAIGLRVGADVISMAGPDRLDFHPEMSEFLRKSAASSTRRSLMRAVSSARPRDTKAIELVRDLFPEIEIRVDFNTRDHNILRTSWNRNQQVFPDLIAWLVGGKRNFRF